MRREDSMSCEIDAALHKLTVGCGGTRGDWPTGGKVDTARERGVGAERRDWNLDEHVLACGHHPRGAKLPRHLGVSAQRLALHRHGGEDVGAALLGDRE